MGIRDYIAEQPDVICRVFEEVPAQVERVAGQMAGRGRPRKVFLVGSGTSRNALIALESFISRMLGCEAAVMGPGAFCGPDGPQDPRGCLALFLSQSGGSTTTVEALRRAQAMGMEVVAITADAASPLASLKSPLVIMPVGSELVGPKTKGYTASIATLIAWALETGRALGAPVLPEAGLAGSIHRFCTGLRDGMDAYRSLAAEMAGAHGGARHLMILGQGRHVGTALEASLKIAEITGLCASAYELEEGMHGRFQALDAESAAILLAATEGEAAAARSVAAVLAALGVPARVVGTGWAPPAAGAGGTADMAPAELDLISAIIPFQILACDLAEGRGMIPERMPYPDLSARLAIKLPRPQGGDGPSGSAKGSLP